MTTDTTNSQDRPMNLGELLDAYKAAILNGTGSTAQRGAIEDHFAFELGIAKTAYRAEKARADEAEEELEREKEFGHSLMQRSEKAESRLAEIQPGVEGLTRWMETFEDGLCQAIRNDPPSNDVFVRLTSVLALLQPQDQADTSGLPG